MTEQKTIIKSFVTALIQADFNQEELEECLEGDMSKMPAEWLAEKKGEPSDADMKEFLDEAFPEEVGEDGD